MSANDPKQTSPRYSDPLIPGLTRDLMRGDRSKIAKDPGLRRDERRWGSLILSEVEGRGGLTGSTALYPSTSLRMRAAKGNARSSWV